MGLLEICSKLFRDIMGLLMRCFFNSSSHHGSEDGDQTSRASSSSTPLGEGSSSTLPSPSEQRYEVFLSFRGETRRGFTDHLYKRLDNAKVSVFRDKEGLPLGERNWPEIAKAIETSIISILVISPEYASSEWCLNELIQILKCKKTFGQLVIPIFYRVTPSDLRKKSYVESRLHKTRTHDLDDTHVQAWKDALIEVSYMTGLELEKIADGYEGELVEIVVAKVLKALRKPTLVVSDDDLVGVDYHIKEIMKMVNVEDSNCVHAILIHGMGGIGKTTLAKVIYNQLTHLFNCYSFLANIRETWSQHKGKVDLQEQLISDILGVKQSISSVDEGVRIVRDRFKYKKVLILLDDVDHRDQLNALAGKWNWFGPGSMLIFTSRMNDVLNEWGGDSFSYELNGLNEDQSFILFCKHAFKKSHSIPNEFHTIAKEIVSTTGGLPLAIEVIGCLLYNKNQNIWKENLKKLKTIPNNEVQNKLKISFDALQSTEQEIFLDMICLPINGSRELAFYMWESCGFYPKLGIEKLVSMSLIKIGKRNELIIHDQLRDLGMEIVHQKSKNDLGKCSRLWKREEALEVLELNQGTQEVETLCLINDSSLGHERCYYTSEEFEGMTRLRYLQMHRVNLTGDFKNLFQNLRWLIYAHGKWDFMKSNFIPKKLVILELSFHGITAEWMGWSQMKDLKVLSLYHCDSLITIPDLSTLKELEVLRLVRCCNLIEIHPSIGILRKSLKVLHINGCEKLELPIQVAKMEELRELILYQNNCIREIPISEGMTKLETLSVTDSEKVECLPDSVGSLVKLRRLKLKGCKLLIEIPKSIGNLKLLVEMDLSGTGVTQLPDSIGDLCDLESLYLSGTPIRCLPTSIRMLSKLRKLELWDCHELELLPSLPRSLTSLEFYGNLLETLPDFSSLTNLEELFFLDDFRRRSRALDFRNLNRMHLLWIENPGFSDSAINHRCKDHSHPFGGFDDVEISKDINLLLEFPSNLAELYLNSCYNLRTLRNFSNLKNLSYLEIRNCPDLLKIEGLDGAEKLKHLTIYNCRNLVEINGLGNIEGIQKVSINDCSSLERIDNLSHLKMLTTLEVHGCDKLSEIRGQKPHVT